SVRPAAELFRGTGAYSRGDWTVRRSGLLGRAAHERDRHPHGARGATGQRPAAGDLAGDAAGAVWGGGGRGLRVRIEAVAGEPIFQREVVATSDGRSTLWRARDRPTDLRRHRDGTDARGAGGLLAARA